MSSAICFNLDQSKILSSGNGLIGQVAKNEQCRSFKIEFLLNFNIIPYKAGWMDGDFDL